ncbi:acyltransferase [Kocuria rhizophila]|nr:acyltransferase [Kocuria rhizophila]
MRCTSPRSRLPTPRRPLPGVRGSGGAGGSRPSDRVSRYSGFRPEVQGLRAVAVLLVVVPTSSSGQVSGGVDVFLFISAFLMTSSLVREVEGGRPLRTGAVLAAHRLNVCCPLATLVVLGTFVLLWLFYPAQDAAAFRSQGVASILYVENWSLAFNAVDYYAADRSQRVPFQHFWSLSVQGQVLPGLAVDLRTRVAGQAAHGAQQRARARGVLRGGLRGLAGVLGDHHAHPQATRVLRHPRPRLWEFALGSLVALAIPYLRPSRGLRVLLRDGLVS